MGKKKKKNQPLRKEIKVASGSMPLSKTTFFPLRKKVSLSLIFSFAKEREREKNDNSNRICVRCR
jgi:hypothetical protein